MSDTRDIRDRILCKSCQRLVFIDLAAFLRYENAGRLVKLHGTGEVRSLEYRPGEYVTQECDECAVKPRRPATVPEQMARIRRHQLEIEHRDVARDDAIRAAVERQVTIAEIKLSPAFVAQVHGLTDLLDAHVEVDAKPVEVDAERDAVMAAPSECQFCFELAVDTCTSCGVLICASHRRYYAGPIPASITCHLCARKLP